MLPPGCENVWLNSAGQLQKAPLGNTSERKCLCVYITQGNQRDRNPHDFTYERDDGEKPGQCCPILPLKGIHHGDVIFIPHRLCEEQTTFSKRDNNQSSAEIRFQVMFDSCG